MITYQCPTCGNKIGAIVASLDPVTCSGMKRELDENSGLERFRPTHSRQLCVIVGDDGVQHTQPKPTTNKPTQGARVMAKEASNLCGCYSEVDSKGVRTSCGRLVKGKFAPGHDAKLKGALIRAAAAGEKFVTKDGTKVTTRDPMQFATELGWGALIAKGVAVATEKANRPARPARKAAAAKGNRVAPKQTVSRDELKARAAAKAAQKANPTGKAAANAKKAAAKEASLV